MGRTIKMWGETMALAAAYSLYNCCAQLMKQFLSNPMLMYAGFVIYAPWGYLSRDFHVLTRIVIQSLLTVIPYMASCRQLLLSLFYSFGYSFIILLYHLLTRTFISLAFLEPILPRNVICLTWNCRSILSLHGKTRKRRETNLETANEDDICVAITLPRLSSLSSCVVINRNRCRPELVWHAGDIIMH